MDTSVAIALVLADHEQHAAAWQSLSGHRLGLAGHAAFETFSVLTRLPTPARLSPGSARRVMAVNFPGTRHLAAAAAAALLDNLAGAGIAGGSVYDALVGATAREHGLTLVTRDHRAVGTYRALDVDVQLLG